MEEEYPSKNLENLGWQMYQQYLGNLVQMEFNITQDNGQRIRYKIQQKIGQGNFSTIYRAKDMQSGSVVATKIQCLYKVNNQSGTKLSALYRNEPINMKKCNNSHVLKCLQIYENTDFRILILEYCDGGTLQKYRKKYIHGLTEQFDKQKQAIKAISQIADGLAEIHSKNMMHRDLKIENVMFHGDTIKIIDMGLSKAYSDQNPTTGSILGTPFTMAPQILTGRYTNKVDVWSIGIILCYLLDGNYPFVVPSVAEKNVKNWQDQCAYTQWVIQKTLDKMMKTLKVNWSAEMVAFLGHLLCMNPKNRYSWSDVCEDQIFKKYEISPPEHHAEEMKETTFEQQLAQL